jgi:hypothetical protein
MTLEDLGLGDRVYDLLSSTGYQTVGDLMVQIELDADAVLGISGIGPKAMEDIHQRLANLSFPQEPGIAPVETVPVVEEPVAEPVVVAPVEEIVKAAEPEVSIPDIVQLPSVDTEQVEPATLNHLETPAVEPAVVDVVGDGTAGAEAGIPQTGDETTQVKSSDFDDLFSLKPGEIGYSISSDDTEEEEDGEQKPGAKKSKKKKKRFVEVVYDPDHDVTLVKRKRKRDGAWGDDWEV